MKVLHYSLGLPPYRSGGLTKYATDLMEAQSDAGDNVSVLYPGDFTFWKFLRMKIKQQPSKGPLSVFEILNPSPVPLLHGVRSPLSIVNSSTISDKELSFFYNTLKPDIFHIHTLMGLPVELVVYLKKKGVKILFTSHDYYGLCPKVNFINHNSLLCVSPSGINCAVCNKTAPSGLFLRLRNSKYILKHKAKFSHIVNNEINSIVSKSFAETDCVPRKSRIDAYDLLLCYYKELFGLIDCFHFNSSVSESIYKSYFQSDNSIVISISHNGIQDNRRIKKYDKKKLNIGFIGSVESYKGFPILREVMLKLENENITNWSLNVWGGVATMDTECKLIQFMGKYSPQDLEKVFDQIDLLIVPSICKETFSLITLEALSFGVPVLVTSNVGAKDIVMKYDKSFIVEPTTVALYEKMKSILENNRELIEYNEKINSNPFDFGLDTHIIEINQLYQSVLNV